ncbi:hypothetical protein HPULCUR_007937 [Helicostylum pulchrum]|uniref:Uncharacterized protein n=1 Tax=Helicostylum pulchrum TaxID=562976 RepID=A0ABP9Y662_9FUNG
MENNSSPMMVPIWAIVIIVIVVVAIVITIFFFLRRQRTRSSSSVQTIHQEKPTKEIKKSESLASFQTLVTQQKQRSMKFEEPCITTTPLPATPKQHQKREEEETTSPRHNQKTDQAASIIDESEYCNFTPEPPQEIKISLPLPPPSTSFFSDKMELDGDHAQDLYDKYLNMSTTNTNTSNKPSEFMSIDFESNSGPSFYTNATANIQQKAATIKTSLYQSLRLQQKGNRTAAQNMFADNDKPKYSGDSYEYQPEKKLIQNSSTITTDSNKTIIDMRVLDLPKKPTLHHLNVTNTDSITIEDESPITPNVHLQEPVRAAKRVIRTASRKTKTRSMMVVDDLDFLPTEDEQEEEATKGNQLFGGTVKEDKRAKHGSIRFASFRGPRNSGEHMTITSGSMRRLVRESILFDDSSMPSMPVASSAAMASTRNTSSRKSGGVSAVDIAGWWDSNNTPKTNNSATTITTEGSDNAVPLFKNVSAGSNSSNTPNQYRASLSTSIFGTLSKSSGAVLSEANKEDQGSISRHGSFRRGTLSRNTLRNLTAGANNVNRSIKGLFDHSANTSSNKIVPDDSQKMELDSEPVQLAVEEKTTINHQEQQQQQQQYNSVRQKSVRNTSRTTRPSLPSTYLPSSESSTKYALSDEECFADDCSRETTSTDQTRALAKLEPVQQQQQKQAATATACATTTTAEPNGEVDTIRRMLQDTWINNMKESGSMFSIASETDSVVTNSTQQSVSTSTSTVSKLLNPRQQNQSLLTKSLLTQQVSQRTSLLASRGRKESIDFVPPQQGPQPSASFSSSTVRTMVPEHTEPVQVRHNAITNNGSNKVQESSFEDRHHNSVLLSSNRFSTTSTAEPSSSARNSSADSSRGHSRKSSGGNSAATALRISSGYSINAKTWNGRANQKRLSRPSVTLDEDVPSTPDSSHLVSPAFQSIGPSGANKRAFFSTMRKGQKHRGGIPWMDDQDQERTPAQIERDRYLEGKF